MEIGIFQLLPHPEGVSDREVIEQALWEVDFAESAGFDSVWVTEHHLSTFGLIGAPSVYAAALAQRTKRVKIGYAVLVVPLHHPLRLLEEILWVGHLSEDRLMVGVGPGFSPYEFGAYGVPLGERRERLDEGLTILRRGLADPKLRHSGKYWSIPEVVVKPRLYGNPPPILRACSTVESLRGAAREGMPVLLGLKPVPEIAEFVRIYRSIRAELGCSPAQIDEEVASFAVLRRVSVAETEQEALEHTAQALTWESETARRVHESTGAGSQRAPTLPDGSESVSGPPSPGTWFGTPSMVLDHIRELQALGLRRVIAWFNFGDMPYAHVRRSMEVLAREVLSKVAASHPPGCETASTCEEQRM